MNKNNTELSEKEICQLRADLQDMHHYAAWITGLAWSTFEGDHEYRGLRGKLRAYESLVKRMTQYYRSDVPALRAFCRLFDSGLRDTGAFNTVSELRHESTKVFKAIQDVARRYECDPNTGERISKS